jgi:hypothetical protein
MAEVITFNTQDVQGVIKNIPPKILIPATVRALNKVAANVRTAASRAIRQRRALTASVVNKALTIRRATRTKLQSSLVVTGRPISLRDYKARQTRKGVTVSVTTGTRKLIPGAFIVQKLGGHVFQRTGKARLPIEKLVGPSLPSTFLQEQVKLAWVSVAKDALVKRSVEELRFELEKLHRRGARA